MNIRTARLETDLTGIAGVINACDPDHPTSMDSLRSSFLDATPGRVLTSLSAGWAENSRNNSSPKSREWGGRCLVFLLSHPLEKN